MKIFKQQLKVQDTQTISVPFNSKILTIQVQCGVPCIWYECDEMNSLTDIRLATFATGQDLPSNHGQYIATYQLNDGQFVYHVYLL